MGKHPQTTNRCEAAAGTVDCGQGCEEAARQQALDSALATAIQPHAPCVKIMSMTTPATQHSEADRLYALGMEKLESGDLVGASRQIAAAAEHAMVTYSDARGWNPENRRCYWDVAAFRRQEMGVSLQEDPLHDGFLSALMLADNAVQDGRLCTERSVTYYVQAVATLIEGFRLDS